MRLAIKITQFFMGLCYISQAFKGEIGRLKASWLFGGLISLVSLLCIIGVANLFHFHIPILLLIPLIITDFILGSKLGALCFDYSTLLFLLINNEAVTINYSFLLLSVSVYGSVKRRFRQ